MFNLPGIFFPNHVIPERSELLDPLPRRALLYQLSYGTIIICGAKVVVILTSKYFCYFSS